MKSEEFRIRERGQRRHLSHREGAFPGSGRHRPEPRRSCPCRCLEPPRNVSRPGRHRRTARSCPKSPASCPRSRRGKGGEERPRAASARWRDRRLRDRSPTRRTTRRRGDSISDADRRRWRSAAGPHREEKVDIHLPLIGGVRLIGEPPAVRRDLRHGLVGARPLQEKRLILLLEIFEGQRPQITSRGCVDCVKDRVGRVSRKGNRESLQSSTGLSPSSV